MLNFKSISKPTTRLGLASILAAALTFGSGLAQEPEAAQAHAAARVTLHYTV